jgi:organic radical activating enzyme
MLKNALKLPWKQHNVPHCLIDIIRGCNVVCENCYNTDTTHIKPLQKVKDEIDFMVKHRKLHSLAIIGGEPLLHPKLDEIIAYVTSKNIIVELFSNGLLLSEERLKTLHKLGVKLIFIHIEEGQIRKDLSVNADEKEVKALRYKIARRVDDAGIESAIIFTSYKHNMNAIKVAVEEAIAEKSITYIIVTLFRDYTRFNPLKGDMENGFEGSLNFTKKTDEVPYSNFDVMKYMFEQFAFKPFAYLSSNRKKDDPRWLSYVLATFYPTDGTEPMIHPIKSGYLEKIYLFAHYAIKGKYPFFQEKDEKKAYALLKLNGFFGGDLKGNRAFLKKISKQKGELKLLRVLFQAPAQIDEDGTLSYCDTCPDAVIIDGKIVPACVGDQM